MLKNPLCIWLPRPCLSRHCRTRAKEVIYMTELDAIFQGFLQGSFSVVVAAFLLVRMEKELRYLREAIPITIATVSNTLNILDFVLLCLTRIFSSLNSKHKLRLVGFTVVIGSLFSSLQSL